MLPEMMNKDSAVPTGKDYHCSRPYNFPLDKHALKTLLAAVTLFQLLGMSEKEWEHSL